MKGFVRTLLGRVRYLPEINSKNAAMPGGFARRTESALAYSDRRSDDYRRARISMARRMPFSESQRVCGHRTTSDDRCGKDYETTGPHPLEHNGVRA